MPKSRLFNEEEANKQVDSSMTEEEQFSHDSDWEWVNEDRQYRDQEAEKWIWAAYVYNIIQNATATDEVTNIAFGWIRSYIDTSLSNMTGGLPAFDYKSYGADDEKKLIMWKGITDKILTESGFSAQQNIAITDAHVMGPGVYEVYQQSPYRVVRIPQLDGSFKEQVTIDYRRPRVGIRAISPHRCTRAKGVSDPNDLPRTTIEEDMSWNEFNQNYIIAINSEGQPKYKTDKVQMAGRVHITKVYDELRDAFRIYAYSYGTKQTADVQKEYRELGKLIYDKSLKIHNIKENGKVVRSEGLNMHGMSPLVYLPFFDKYDANMQTHSLFGMGLPEHLEGLDTFIQTAFNMTVDNWRLANTTLIDYAPRDGEGFPDFDASAYYGGEFVNAQINPQNLGNSSTIDFTNMFQSITQNIAIPGTGINVSQISGDTSRTAFEFSQRVQANNRRAERIIKAWEDGPYKRLGNLVLSAGLSDLTVEDLEDLDPEQSIKAQKDLKSGKAIAEDFVVKNGKPTQRKRRQYVRIKGMREDISKSKTRSLESGKSTLVFDLDSPDKEHSVAITKTYVYDDDYIETGVMFDVVVDGSRQIATKKIRDNSELQFIINSYLQMAQVDPKLIETYPPTEFFKEAMNIADFDEEKISKKEDEGPLGDMKQKLKNSFDMLDSLQSNAQALPNTQVPINPEANAAQPSSNPGAGQGVAGALAATAAGAL